MIKTRVPLAGHRSLGFTLVELLIVIAIIAVLMSLVASGVFRYLEVQTETNAEVTIRTVHKILQQQIEAVISQVDKEALPSSVIALGSNNGSVPDPQQKRARVIWKSLRLVQEFPMTYQEALNPSGTIGAGSPLYGVLYKDLPPIQTYVNALKTAKGFTTPLGPAVVPGAPGEASTLLLLALQQTRSGVTFSPDSLRSAAVDTNGDGLKEIVDGWGNPIAFFRFPTGNPLDPNYANSPGFELDQTKSAAILFRTPLDPEGTLLNPSWNNPSLLTDKRAGIFWFEQLCHLVHDPKTNKARSYYAPFVIVSAGREGLFGLNDEVLGPHSVKDSVGGYRGDMGVTNANWANDNIYSFRLQLGARGD